MVEPDNNRIIELNVGGVFYTTFRTTLTSYPDSLFNALLRNPTWVNNRLFVDRNGTVFQYILDFLRGSEILPNTLQERQLLIQEAKYFVLDGLVEKIVEHDKHRHIEIQDSQGLFYVIGFEPLCREIFGENLISICSSLQTLRFVKGFMKDRIFDSLYSNGFRLITAVYQSDGFYKYNFARD